MRSVFNERSKEYYKQDNAIEYAYITADEYSPQELIETEKGIIQLLCYKLNYPTIIHYVKILIQAYALTENVTKRVAKVAYSHKIA